VTASSITSAGATGATSPTGADSTDKPDPLGRDAFLSLLVTQLEHQNPLEPQPDGEFLAQLAQFSSLEKLQQMSSDMSELLALAKDKGAAATTAASGPASSLPSSGGL
jgi:flagellar basal-body rod modification protein FlgD